MSGVPGGDALVAAALRWIGQHRLDGTAPVIELTATTDLLTTGVLDSLAFVELVAHLEELSGAPADLVDLEPEVFATPVGLCGAFPPTVDHGGGR